MRLLLAVSLLAVANAGSKFNSYAEDYEVVEDTPAFGPLLVCGQCPTPTSQARPALGAGGWGALGAGTTSNAGWYAVSDVSAGREECEQGGATGCEFGFDRSLTNGSGYWEKWICFPGPSCSRVVVLQPDPSGILPDTPSRELWEPEVLREMIPQIITDVFDAANIHVGKKLRRIIRHTVNKYVPPELSEDAV